MRLLVTGTREATPRVKEEVFKALWNMVGFLGTDEEIVLIHGAAKGVDTFVDEWAKEMKGTFRIVVIRCPANWKKHGKPAGAIRNSKMLKNHRPDTYVAVPGPKSIGTWDMVTKLAEAKIPGITWPVLLED